ncbi:hypothetical protein [Bacillus subtilis]|uniref:Uncharacterized protein n=1 Tax=Bacillus subtilis TaxID=1423 RepID=A0AC61YWS5_BACIU|nr:hypothetical protein [Bacillus subtilis]UNL88103.1 hypothetical protein IE382_13640 [Bacillus subtilis]WGE07098.1 hypothetical protein P5658_18540 [Bacillus subtilis]WIT27629.1 hypothetical protein [Bacillus phage SPbetaL5]
MSRINEVREFIEKLHQLEERYNIEVITEDNYVGLLYLDKTNDTVFEYSKGNISEF